MEKSASNFLDESPTVTIRLSDIVAFRAPEARLVDMYIGQLRAGKKIDPIEIDSEWVEHWYDGEGESQYLGMGYALLEGHDRHAALVAYMGAHAECEVVMQGLQPMKGWRVGRP